MTERNLVKIFAELKKEIAKDFSFYLKPKEFRKISLKILRFEKDLGSNFPHYTRLKKIPAFYEHEKRAINFNEGFLELLKKSLIKNILYHELLHAISFRKIKRSKKKILIRSGFFTQVLYSRSKTERFRRLNEGIIQYLTNRKTGFLKKSGYYRESKIVAVLVKKINEEKMKDLFFKGEVEKFSFLVKKYFHKGILKELK